MSKGVNARGLTLMELILALAMTGVVLLAVSSLNLSSMRASIQAGQDTKMQEELNFVFRDMEIHLRSGIAQKALEHHPAGSGAVSCKTSTGTSTETPCFLRENDTKIWLGVERPDPVHAGQYQEVWYGYTFNAGTGNGTIVRRIWIDADSAWDNVSPVVLSQGILAPHALCGPYVPESGGGCSTNAGNATAYRTCMGNPTAGNCENASPKIWPVFQSIDYKNIFVSFRGKQGTVNGIGVDRDTSTDGMTKAIFISGSSD